MKNHTHPSHRILALLLTFILAMSLLPTSAFAGQADEYHDPAEHWLNAGNRTNELDANAIVTHETYYCYVCKQQTNFTTWRVPEYARNGESAMTRNVIFSDGTCRDGVTTGTILDAVPGDGTYTGYHWCKSCCDTCGSMNSNIGTSYYSVLKNVYTLYDCAPLFTEQLEDEVSYACVDGAYHRKDVTGGTYCEFCYGTRHTHASALEPHDLETVILPQPGHQRFAVVRHCGDCGYTDHDYIGAKAVVASYFGEADGQAHTIQVTDLSESGVSARIRYGNSADACT